MIIIMTGERTTNAINETTLSKKGLMIPVYNPILFNRVKLIFFMVSLIFESDFVDYQHVLKRPAP
jgi:hypothetical protein